VGEGLQALQRKRGNSVQLLKKPTEVPPTGLVPPLTKSNEFSSPTSTVNWFPKFAIKKQGGALKV
jgi:hypothetical protein